MMMVIILIHTHVFVKTCTMTTCIRYLLSVGSVYIATTCFAAATKAHDCKILHFCLILSGTIGHELEIVSHALLARRPFSGQLPVQSPIFRFTVVYVIIIRKATDADYDDVMSFNNNKKIEQKKIIQH